MLLSPEINVMVLTEVILNNNPTFKIMDSSNYSTISSTLLEFSNGINIQDLNGSSITSAGGDITLQTGGAGVLSLNSGDNIQLSCGENFFVSTNTTTGIIQFNSPTPTYFNLTTPNTADGVISVAEINRNNGDITINSQNDNLFLNAGDSINLTATTGNIKITPTNTISTTIVPYGLYLDSSGTKTYPTTVGFNAYPIYKTVAELGTNQIYDTSTGINFIYGDSRVYTKSAGTTSDIERLYFNSFSQSFGWTDANTCKQYVGISDSFSYNGKDANSRTSSSFNADSVTLNCPSFSTQTIANINAKTSLRISAGIANATYTITNTSSPNLQFNGSGANVIANITNHSFFENNTFWDANWTGSMSLATITNMYGLRLNPPNGGTTTGLTITNNWGIYSGWSSAKNYFAGAVSIGTTTPSSSAILQTDSTTQGFLPPRMTGIQANTIVGPAEGLMVYVTDSGTGPFVIKGWWGYNGAGWTQIG